MQFVVRLELQRKRLGQSFNSSNRVFKNCSDQLCLLTAPRQGALTLMGVGIKGVKITLEHLRILILPTP